MPQSARSSIDLLVMSDIQNIKVPMSPQSALEPLRQYRWFLIFSAFVISCALFGGSSRTDNPAMLVVRSLSVIYIIGALLLPSRRFWQGLGWPLLLLGTFAITMAIQLIPLPPAIWSQLPGHERFAAAAVASNLPQPWHPISLSPDLTINSLLALIVPLATIVGMATLPPAARRQIIPIILLSMIISAILGIGQWAGGTSSPFYIYQYTSRDLPVGLFANRNHQAVFLAIGLPLLRLWAVLPSRIVPRSTPRAWLAGSSALLMMLVILATGSRSGFVLALVAVVSGFVITPPDWKRLFRSKRSSRARVLVASTVVCIVCAAAIGSYLSGRAVSVTRLMQAGQVETDLRVRFFPIVTQMTRDFLPVGSGQGTFERLFHVYEPLWAVKRTNYNHAHNDLIELILTGGIPALLVLLGYIGFLCMRARVFLTENWSRPAIKVAAGSAVGVLLMFAASLTDYPLRTPAFAMLFSLMTVLLTVSEAGRSIEDNRSR